MDLGIAGRTAVITGASQGIGAATAKVFAAEGVNVVLVARNTEKMEQVRKDILAQHAVRVDLAVHDLSDSEEIDKLAARYTEVDIVVNCAGATPGGTIFEVDDKRWREGFDSKVFPYINMCRAFYPLLKARGGGVIINVIGTGSKKHEWSYACGGMANAALDFLTHTLGAGSPRDNIRVVGVAPGPTDTERYRKVAVQRSLPPDHVKKYPFGRTATPQELADVIVFAASERSSYTSGAIFTVDGGLSLTKWQQAL